MRILLASLIFLFTAWLPGQCIDVQIDSVFCLGNGEYGILYDVEGTGDNGWVLEGYGVSGSYFTDEIRQLSGLFGQATVLAFRDSIDPDCVFEVEVVRPDQCNTTDPCFGFVLNATPTPGSCGQGVRIGLFPDDVGVADSILVINEAGDIVATLSPPEFPGFVDVTDLAPGAYTATATVNNECTLTADFIITDTEGCGSISGFTWLDEIENGLRDPDERLLSGVTINLLNALDFNEIIATTVSTPNGYFFSDVPPGEYVLRFFPRRSNAPTTYQVGEDPSIDNDVSADFVTVTITVGVDEAVVNIDGGFLESAGIGDFVFTDENANGQQDASDEGIEGVVVNLLNAEGNTILTTITDENGFYQFANLTPGEEYIVEFVSPAGSETAPSAQGDDATDSDADETTGLSPIIVLEPNEFNPTIDVGFYETASIGDFVFFDQNSNGRFDSGDVGFEDVTVGLFVGDAQVATTTTDETGFYEFTDLTPGEGYVVEFVAPADFEFTIPNQGNDGADSNADQETGRTNTIVLVSGENNATIDAGLRIGGCSVILISDDGTCNGENDGSAFADPSGEAPFTYLWSNGATSQTIGGLAPGIYSVTVTDANGCVTGSTIGIGESSPIQLVIDELGNSCSDFEHFLQASVFGGTAPYTYEWENNDFFGCQGTLCSNPAPGDYFLTVTDANGCTVTSAYTVTEGDLSINFFAPFYLGCNGEAVTISAVDFGDFDYTWISPSGLTLTGATIEATELGTYTISGTLPDIDCDISGEAVVIAAPSLADISLQVIDSSECGFGNCVYPTGTGENDINQVSYTWYGPNGNVVQTNGFLCTEEAGLFILVAAGVCDTATLSIELNIDTECADLNGTVYIDEAGNCSFDAGDLPVEGILVHIQSTDGIRNYYAITNENGQYGQEVAVGDYTVTPITDQNRPFGQCDPATTVTVVAGQPNQADAFLPVLLSCPLLTVDVSMPFLRRCFLSCAYIEYENEGSAVAENAQLVVTLDPLFIGVDPSIVPSMIDGNTYTFDLGDLPPFASGRIYFNFTVSCDSDLGQSHCLEATITPNDICNRPDDWNGALVSVDPGTCDGNEVSFRIANIGDNTMSVPLSYVVVEDGIMMTPQPQVIEELTPDEIFTITLPADGQTYQIITNQEPNAPASETPTAMLEGCTGSTVNGGTTGFANILSLGNGFPWEAIVCRENVGAYDPNDKNGYPLGHGAENNIAPGTELLYAIRFQNTGTDTAFNVVIRDTISAALDLSTFKAESSSHDYTVSIDSQRVVTFTFANIMLPDSNVNLLASQGVVNFSIDHDPDLVAGDLITNEAAIYFDFNEPIITNLSQHQIEKDGLPVGVRTLRAQEVSLRVFPNPSNGFIQLTVPNNDVKYSDVLTVSDLYGRQLAKTTFGQIGSGWDVRTLPAGYYLLVVHDEAGRARGRAGFIVAE